MDPFEIRFRDMCDEIATHNRRDKIKARTIEKYIWAVIALHLAGGLVGLGMTISGIGVHCPRHEPWSVSYVATRILSGPTSIIDAFREDGCTQP